MSVPQHNSTHVSHQPGCAVPLIRTCSVMRVFGSLSRQRCMTCMRSLLASSGKDTRCWGLQMACILGTNGRSAKGVLHGTTTYQNHPQVRIGWMMFCFRAYEH